MMSPILLLEALGSVCKTLSIPVYRERSWEVWTEEQHQEWRTFIGENIRNE